MPTPFAPDRNYIAVKTRFTGPRRSVLADTVLDTGASYTLIAWDLAEALGYDPAAMSERRKVTTVSGIETIPLIQVAAIEALGQRARALTVGVHDMPPQAEVNALLGLDFFRQFGRLTIDFARGLIELE